MYVVIILLSFLFISVSFSTALSLFHGRFYVKVQGHASKTVSRIVRDVILRGIPSKMEYHLPEIIQDRRESQHPHSCWNGSSVSRRQMPRRIRTSASFFQHRRCFLVDEHETKFTDSLTKKKKKPVHHLWYQHENNLCRSI